MALPVPNYGDQVVDTQGRTGEAKFNPNTGEALAAPTSAPQPQSSTESPYYPRYTGQNSSYTAETPTPAPKSVDEVQGEMTKAAQGEINSLNSYYQTLLNEQKTINDKNDRSTAAVNTLTGLAGSTEANVTQQATSKVGQEANQKILAQQQVQVQGILSDIRKSAIAEARAQRDDYRLSEEDRVARKAAAQKESESYLKNLSASGVTFNGLKSNDPDSFNHLVKQYGSEDALKGAFVLNTPQDQILDKKIIGSSYVISRQNPITGKITVDNIEIPGLKPDYSASVDLGDRIMFYDPSDPQGKQFFVGKGLTPNQAVDNGSGGQYTPKQLAALNKINENVSKNATYAKTTNMRGYADNVATSLSQGTGVGDLAAINQFQKVIDEGAVTRDQDVKLIQQSQSLLNTLKTKMTKLEKGEQLSPELRSQMKQAVESLYQAQVKALAKDPYIKAKTKEAKLYGLTEQDTIIGELGSFSSGEGQTITAPDGQEVIITD